MNYPIQEDFLYIPVEASDEQIKTSNLLSSLTGISYERILNCICRFGVDMVLDNPFILGVSEEEQQTITDMRELFFLMRRV